MQETQGDQSLGWGDSLEEEMATHSSVLAWRTPWTEVPERLSTCIAQPRLPESSLPWEE